MTGTHAFDREEVMAYLDGELTAGREVEVRAHLEACDECRGLVEGFREISTTLRAWQVEPAPATLRVEATRRTFLGWPRWTLIAVPVGLVLLVVLLAPQYAARKANAPSVIAAPAGGPAASPVEAEMRPRGMIGSQGRGQGQGPGPGQGGGTGQGRLVQDPGVVGPMIVRTAALKLSTDRFDEARAGLEQLIAAHQGRFDSLRITGEVPARRLLQATARVPSAGLDAALSALRKLGRVRDESLASEEITDSFRDLQVRLANSRREEQRLVELLANRTGNLKDVLAVEEAIARVRGEIEQMEAQERGLKGRVDFATVTIQIDENYRAEMTIDTLSLGARLRNAAVDGIRTAATGLIDVLLWALAAAPSLLIWALVLLWPARRLWRRLGKAA